MLDAVHQAASEATDTLVVYFTGHGMRSPDDSLHLAPRNSEQGRKLYESVSFEYLRAEVLDSMASRSVVILDCCYSGAALEGHMDNPGEFADQTAIEYDLLRERSGDEHFQDGCLFTFHFTFHDHLLQRHQISSPFPEHETAHGTWGPLPWWSIALHGEHERRAAEAILDHGGMQVSITAKNHAADELFITCWESGHGPSELTACLRFDLRDAVHACELLLLARRQSVAVDFLAEHIDAWDDREIRLIGTMNIAIDGEVGANSRRHHNACATPAHARHIGPSHLQR